MKRFFCLLLALFLFLPLLSCGSTPAPEEVTPSEETESDPADYSALYAVLETVPEDRSPYTRASLAALDAAVESVRYGLKEEDQKEVDKAVSSIEEAIAALEKKVTFSSYAEIITYVDSLGFDFDDLAAFDLSGYFEDTLLTETEDAGEEYLNETYYIGDSLTLYMHRYSTVPKENIFGVGSINPQHAALDDLVTLQNGQKGTFAEAMEEIQPRRVVLTIGTNSMLMDSIDYITYFGMLVDDIQSRCPDTDVILQSTSPLTAEYEANMRLLTNRNINRSNALLAGLAAYKGVYYLNTAEALKNENGQLDVKFDLGEGYGHINADAYAVWESYLRTHAIP